MPNSRLSDSHGPLLKRIASTTRNVRIDILDEQETLLAPVGLCDLCSMPNKPGYDYCYPCSRAPRAAVDGLIPLAFAPKGEQLYRDLVAYKRQSTPSPAFRRLAALARVSSCHMPCIERVYGTIECCGRWRGPCARTGRVRAWTTSGPPQRMKRNVGHAVQIFPRARIYP